MAVSLRKAAAGFLFFLAVCVSSQTAFADPQVTPRLGVGGGVRGPDLGAVFELRLRTDVLFGSAVGDVVRIGPALDLRTANFGSFDAALGAAVLLPVARDLPITTTVATGWSAREHGRTAWFLLTEVAWGFRPYSEYSPYAHCLDVYVAGRTDLSRWNTGAAPIWEVTLGVEADFELLAMPWIYLYKAFLG